jgi:hypothetical protein
MLQILTWILISYGITNIVVFGKIFDGARNFLIAWGESKDLPLYRIFRFFGDLVSCPMCFGFWCGILLNLTLFSPTNFVFNTHQLMSWFFDGVLSSGTIWIIYVIVNFFENEE